jgi:predicted metal-dependent HD superfamily phosphohydrolase
MNLKERYYKLADAYIKNNAEKSAHWKEIEENYTAEGRYYHNLSHLENMFQQLDKVSAKLHDAESVQWAVYYHDLIYDVQRSDNEERSADSAFALLMSYGVSKKKCLAVHNMILATKKHEGENENDLNYLLDADLSILGADKGEYKLYAKNIRKEYNYVPEQFYFSGRKSVLEHFLKMERIFRSEYFYDLYEATARENIKNEITTLSSLQTKN